MDETGVGGDLAVSASVAFVAFVDDDAPLAKVIDLWADPDAGRYVHFPVAPGAPDEPLDWVFGPRPRHLSLVPPPDEPDAEDDAFVEPTPATGILALVPPELVLLAPGTAPIDVVVLAIEDEVAANRPLTEHELTANDLFVETAPTTVGNKLLATDVPAADLRAVAPAANELLAPEHVAPIDAPVPFAPLPIELLPLTLALPIEAPRTAIAAAASDASDATDAVAVAVAEDHDDGEPHDDELDGLLGSSPSARPLGARPLKFLLVVATWLSYVIVAGAAWMLIWATIPRAFGWQPIVITGGSMEPAIDRGDIILARPVPTSALVPGAVITFTDPNRPGQLITHRIVSIKPDGSLETRGDHNGTPDPQPVAVRTVRGRAVLRLPYLGRPVVWIQQQNWPPLAGSMFVLVASLALVSRSRRRAGDDADDVDDVDDGRGDDSVERIDDDDNDDASNPPSEPLAPSPLPPPNLTSHGWRPPLLARPGGQARAARRRAERRPTLIISRGIEPSR